MTKPKILFVYDHKYPKFWMDGLWAALNVLEEDFEVERMNLSTNVFSQGPRLVPDFILGWGAFGSSVDKYLQDWKVKGKKALCIAGNAIPPSGEDNYNVLFYETEWYGPQIANHPNTVRAFGVNTDIYSPSPLPTPIVWDYIGVGAFANWKRWEKMVAKPGTKLVIGEYQEDNEEESLEIVRNLVSNGVMVSNMINPFELAQLYSYSRTLYQPADLIGGGERSVLEAKACGLSVEIEPDNPKLQELLDMKEVPDHITYAKQLKKGIMSVI